MLLSAESLCCNVLLVDPSMNLIKYVEVKAQRRTFMSVERILPNSNLTYQIIKKQLVNNTKLLKPIYLTNIFLEEVKDLPKFNERKYELGFVAYNWKRQCKNYDLVKRIIIIIC